MSLYKKKWYSLPVYDKKPKNWKFIKPKIYSSSVIVNDIKNNEFIGYIELQYKLKTRTELDEKWVENQLKKIFNTIPSYLTNQFKRDGGPIIFISSISLSKEEYIQTKRKLKLERILKY